MQASGWKVRMNDMNELRIAICEDEPEESEKLLRFIGSSGMDTRTDVFENGEDLLKTYKPDAYDLIFMDIYLSGLSGVDTVRAIRQTDKRVPIAFTTTSADHALDGYRLDVMRYMEKPVTADAVLDALKLAERKRRELPGLQIAEGRKNLSIPLGQILYVEQKAHDLYFHLTGNRILKARGRLDEIESSFPPLPYIRCHKSYLANLDFVTGLDKELMVFHMKDGSNVHIRRENLKKAKDAWETRLFDMARKAGTDET